MTTVSENASVFDSQCRPGMGTEKRRPVPARHYPTALIDVWKLRDGTRITQRPVLPQDSSMLGDMMSRLSPSSRRNRFHGSLKTVPAQWIDSMTRVDHEQHVAFVMTTTQGGHERIIADARYFVSKDDVGDCAEFAVVVDDCWQRRGLGTRAMETLKCTATDAGLRWMRGDVLANNQAMLALMRSCKFGCTLNLFEDGLVIAQSSLSRSARSLEVPLAARLRRWLPWQFPIHTNTQGELQGGPV